MAGTCRHPPDVGDGAPPSGCADTPIESVLRQCAVVAETPSGSKSYTVLLS
jgi:hypothetical protein